VEELFTGGIQKKNKLLKLDYDNTV